MRSNVCYREDRQYLELLSMFTDFHHTIIKLNHTFIKQNFIKALCLQFFAQADLQVYPTKIISIIVLRYLCNISQIFICFEKFCF